MKRIFLLALGFVALLSSCHDPEYVNPNTERQGLTSLTAIFTSGPFVNQEMAKLYIEDEGSDRYVIQVPWFYPETSDDETAQYMTKVRVQADLDNNCSIEPVLTILDLTQENWFTYTNAKGAQRKICITGERVKSNKCELEAFSLVEPALNGVIDKANKKVSIISTDDLSSCLANVQISAHASITPDPTTVAQNYNEPVELTVVAHDGVTKQVYTVKKDVPAKIPYGFNTNKVAQLFNFDPVATLGMPAYTTAVGPTLAVSGGKLLICLGDGSNPTIVNGINGAKEGEMNVGSAVAGSVTNDDAEHILIVNKTTGEEGNRTLNIYRANSVKETPTLYYSYECTEALPAGSKIKVNGNIDDKALIVIPYEGVAGVTSANQFMVFEVVGGAITNVSVQAVGGGVYWGAAPVNSAGICAASNDMVDGFFECMYDPSNFHYIKNDGSFGCELGADSSGWGKNPNCLDAKVFNNAQYLAVFVVSHFPAWGMGPEIYIMDVTDKANLTGSNIWDTPALVLANNAVDWYQTAAYSIASGDVVIAPSADGFTFNVYYYDHNSQVIGGYTADCIAE